MRPNERGMGRQLHRLIRSTAEPRYRTGVAVWPGLPQLAGMHSAVGQMSLEPLSSRGYVPDFTVESVAKRGRW